MPDFTSVVIIFNPNSTGNAPGQARELRERLSRHLPSMPIRLDPTQHAGHAVELAYQAAKSEDKPLIISASGDGGYNEVVNGALRAQEEGAAPICAVLPSGNANDHARTTHDETLSELILSGAVTRLDVLKISITGPDQKDVSRYAHSYVGLGLTPAVAIELNKHTLHAFKDAWVVCKTFWSLRPVVVRTAEGDKRLDSLVCSIIPEMAKVLTLSKEASADDGLFELTTLPHNQKIRLLVRLLRGVVQEMGASSRAKAFNCTILQPAPIQFDGEVMKLSAGSQLSVSICPHLLRTIARP